MEYTIKQLAELTDVSTRALRYYDQINLLKPSRTNEAGYRYYGPEQVDRLQQVLFYRELGLPLAEIAALLDDPHFDPQATLQNHLLALKQQRDRLDSLILTVEKTIRYKTGEVDMSDNEKFKGFKQKLLRENKEKYGKELQAKYDKVTLDQLNRKISSLSKEEYEKWTTLETELLFTLEQAVRVHADPNSELGKQLVELHRKWLSYSWVTYSPAAHKGLAQMYVCDKRFTSYYDRNITGCAVFLHDAILLHA